MRIGNLHSVPARSRGVSAADKSLYLRWQCGPTAEQVARSVARSAALWQGIEETKTLGVNYCALAEKVKGW